MVHFSTAGVVARSLAIFSSPFGKRTSSVDQVKVDIAAITRDVYNLDAAVSGFPNTGGSFAQGLAVETVAMALDFTINKCTTDAKGLDTLGEADANSILQSVQALLPVISIILNKIVAKKPGFQSIPFGTTLVRNDLITLSTDTSALGDALIALAPTADIKAASVNIQADLNAAFAAAIAAFL